jgi:DNA modification methylase
VTSALVGPSGLAEARRAVAEATDLREVAALVDRLAVIRHAARKARLSLDQQNDWALLALSASRKAGQLLSEMRLSGGLREGRPTGRKNADSTSANPGGTLGELGISQVQSSRWQRAALPDEAAFQGWASAVRDAGEEITQAGLLAFAARVGADRAASTVVSWPRARATEGLPRNTLLVGDCLEILPTLPAESVPVIITDPPWGIAAQPLPGAEPWDHFEPRAYEEWCRAWAAELLRVAIPGALAFVFGGTRTWHRLASGLEDAGWSMRDSLMWAWGNSLPKSVDLGALDPAWAGYGTALRPAWTPILVFRKPSPLGVAETALGHGTGALRVDGDRWPGNLWLDDAAGELLDQATGRPVSRLLYYPKPKRGEREAGLEHLVPQEWAAAAPVPQRGQRPNRPSQNPVAALKPLALMRALVRLAVPPGALVLDAFGGSGTLALAVQAEGEDRDWLLIERDPQTAEVARARLRLPKTG